MSSRIARVRILLVTLILTCSVGGSLAMAEVVKGEIRGINNFSQVADSVGFAGPLVGFGGATEPAALAVLREMGYASVINLRMGEEENVALESSRAAAADVGLNYIHLPFDAQNPSPGLVDRFLEIAGDAANQPVYIHCNSATRVGALWMIGRMTRDHWERGVASREIQQIAGSPEQSIAFAMSYLSDSLD